jgi:pimeloyl-ACP methyl ester carboxylesterase
MGNRLRQVEQRLFDHYGLDVAPRDVWLEDPPLRVRVLEAGDGPALLVIHGSGMAASTWAPLLPHLAGRRLVAVDLPGFGLSDPYDYGGRSLRRHAVAQVRSLLDALALARADIVGTSLGAMWALSFAHACPERVGRVVSIGVPAVALPGMHGDRFFSLVSMPVAGALAVRLRPPSAGIARRALADVLGPAALERTPDEWFEVVRHAMGVPGWPRAMRSHMRLALHPGRPRAENSFSDDELSALRTPVLFIWGDHDVYGSPEIGRRAAALMPDARLAVVPGNHAPFLDDPERCAALIAGFLGVVPERPPGVR